MARKKTDNAAEVNTEAQVTVETVTAEPQAVAQTPDNTNVTTIPQYVEKILTRYPNYAELYVDAKGGVYISSTQQNIVKDAILYKNPYYKQ